MLAVKVQHFLQTRFSVKDVSWAWESFPAEWLESRVALFEAYCLPSVAAQTNREFEWLVYCDESTDPAVRAQLESHRGEAPLRVVVTGEGHDPLDATGALIESDTELVLSTRLDSDDALHRDYVAAAQAYVEPFARCGWETLLLNFPRGYKLDAAADRVYESRIFNSSYPTLFEPTGGSAPFRSVLSGSHSRFHQLYPCHQDESLAAWLQVLHGGNMINHRWGGEPEVGRDALEGFSLAEGGRRDYYTERPEWEPSSRA